MVITITRSSAVAVTADRTAWYAKDKDDWRQN